MIARSTSTEKLEKKPISIPSEYADFADVFDKIAADSLPEHRPYDLKIELEEGSEPPLS